MIMASMRDWLQGGDLSTDAPARSPRDGGDTRSQAADRVVVVHCKAGKGRSGTISCSYLVAEENWKAEDALARFTERRMRPNFGAGVSIPSQLRWVRYVDRWARAGKKYHDGPLEVVEIRVWGLRNGVKLDVGGFVDEGKKIESFHTFKRDERTVLRGDAPETGGLSHMVWEMASFRNKAPPEADLAEGANPEPSPIRRKYTQVKRQVSAAGSQHGSDKERSQSAGCSTTSPSVNASNTEPPEEPEPGGMVVILRPKRPVAIPNSDVQVSVELRHRSTKNIGFNVVAAVAHVWFNAFFEGNGPERNGHPDDTGVFTIDWDAMDGIKGTSRKGVRALDRLAVVWRTAKDDKATADDQDAAPRRRDDQPVPQMEPADWKGARRGNQDSERDLGLRTQSPASADISRASSMRSAEMAAQHHDENGEDGASLAGVKASGPGGGELEAEVQHGL